MSRRCNPKLITTSLYTWNWGAGRSSYILSRNTCGAFSSVKIGLAWEKSQSPFTERKHNGMQLYFKINKKAAYNTLGIFYVIAVAIGAQPTRELQTKNGASIIQELTLFDQDYKPICLTMWDHFVDNESAAISNVIKSKLVIGGARLKVVLHNGMFLSTRSSSSFIIKPNNSEVVALQNWAIANQRVFDETIQNKSYLKASSSSTTASNRTITQIVVIPKLAKTQFSFWVKAKIIVCNLQQTFWYMACNKCSKSTSVEVDETFACLNCKETDAIAQSRFRVEVELNDASGSLVSSLFGEDTEKVLGILINKINVIHH